MKAAPCSPLAANCTAAAAGSGACASALVCRRFCIGIVGKQRALVGCRTHKQHDKLTQAQPVSLMRPADSSSWPLTLESRYPIQSKKGGVETHLICVYRGHDLNSEFVLPWLQIQRPGALQADVCQGAVVRAGQRIDPCLPCRRLRLGNASIGRIRSRKLSTPASRRLRQARGRWRGCRACSGAEACPAQQAAVVQAGVRGRPLRLLWQQVAVRVKHPHHRALCAAQLVRAEV